MLQVIFHGHAFVEIVLPDGVILIDPFVSDNPLCDVGIEDMIQKNIKAIILTHGHSDHILDAISLSKINNSLIIATAELADYLMNIKAVQNVHKMHIGGEHTWDDFSVKFVNAVHGGGIGDMKQCYGGCAAGVVIRSQDRNIYHAGDTALTYDMKLLGEYDEIDLAFLPIGDNFTMGIKDAVIANSFIKPKTVIPMHYDTWEVIKADPNEFAKQIMSQNISVPKVLNPGQMMVLK